MMNILLDLYLTFMQVGGLTFGGGYAMLPMLQREVVEKKKWATEEEVMDYYAIGQCTPGIIAINTATFVGYKMAGIIGSIVATLGILSPCWVIITIISLFLKNFAEYAVVQHALAGITVAVFALIVDAVLKLGKKSIIDAWCAVIFFAIFALKMVTPIPSAFLIVGSGFVGVLFSWLKAKGQAETNEVSKEVSDN